MTKRMIIAVCFISVALITSISAYIFLRSSSMELIKHIDFAIEKETNGENCVEETESLLSKWQEFKPFFGVLLKHTDADELDRYFIVIENVGLSSDSAQYVFILNELRASLIVILDGEAPSLENIF